jgi:hypothetical protein
MYSKALPFAAILVLTIQACGCNRLRDLEEGIANSSSNLQDVIKRVQEDDTLEPAVREHYVRQFSLALGYLQSVFRAHPDDSYLYQAAIASHDPQHIGFAVSWISARYSARGLFFSKDGKEIASLLCFHGTGGLDAADLAWRMDRHKVLAVKLGKEIKILDDDTIEVSPELFDPNVRVSLILDDQTKSNAVPILILMTSDASQNKDGKEK